MHARPLFYIYKLRATTLTITTNANNGVGQHEPAEKRAKCQVSDHISIGKRWSECVGWDTCGGCPCTC